MRKIARTLMAHLPPVIRNHLMSTLLVLYGLVFGLAQQALPNYIPDIDPYLLKPFQWVARWQPQNGFQGILQFIVLSLIYVVIGSFLVLLIRLGYIWVFGKKENYRDDVLELYRDEFAATVESVDGLSNEDANENIQELLHTIVDTVAVRLGLRRKDFRALFFIPDLSAPMDPQQRLDGYPLLFYEIGHQFDLSRTGRMSPEAFHFDIQLISQSLDAEEREIIHTFDHFNSDIRFVFITRNPGHHRLGFYLGARKCPDVDKVSDFLYQISSFIMTLAFVDAVRDFIVEWNRGGDSNAEPEQGAQ
ncbi:MAG: hypothetical protein K6T81_14510 [Alicyclobacillus macrosporangiidus]|uniref:MAPEG family protein n=1 Tax=Alicyclobacillus macrosporangiidus TaxID=392015 RepID=UPI0026EAAF85|nr:MAPEG family protein [Alicyclobacillus macrosporangiidus]MCL6599928.1 hypothetical protein [Alicyclobacillus macrosporangiidus]